MTPLRIDPERLAVSLRDVHEELGDDELLPMLHAVLAACDDLFSLAGCGLLIEDAENGLQFAAATNVQSHALEEAQVTTAEGPCVDAFVEGSVIETKDLAVDDRWPKLAKAALELQVHGVLGCPVYIDGITVGSLDVYLDAPHEWDDSERRAILRFADVVGSMLSAALRVQKVSEIASQLRQALESRVVIERAVGYLMARADLTAPEAFETLRGAARSQRRKVRQLAAEVLRGEPLDKERRDLRH